MQASETHGHAVGQMLFSPHKHTLKVKLLCNLSAVCYEKKKEISSQHYREYFLSTSHFEVPSFVKASNGQIQQREIHK
jgi:hypothetical protein